MDGYTLNAARTIREYESSIQRPKAERTINDSILSALLRGDELPEMDVKAIRQYGIQCSEYLDFGYDVDASLSGMLSPHAVLEPRPNTPYVFRRAGFDNLPFIYISLPSGMPRRPLLTRSTSMRWERPIR